MNALEFTREGDPSAPFVLEALVRPPMKLENRISMVAIQRADTRVRHAPVGRSHVRFAD
jgi:hypothetical protein